MSTCAVCRKPLADGSRFCHGCGAAATDDALTRTVATPVSRTSAVHSSPDARFLPGALVASRYRIIALLGRGGMGEVYRADDLTLGQQVALKFLPESLAADPDAVERFRNEVRTARRVSHPNVCRVYDLGEVDGHLFLSMEYVDGEDLGSLLRRIGRLPQDKALEIGRRLCAGLAAAHEKGVLHRDLKPANVMLDGRGHALLTDFGLASIADRISGAEIRNGTPAYMAPEQLDGKEVTVKSDLYSLGLVLYELLTGKRAYESDTLAGLEKVRSQRTVTNPSTLVKDLDPRVERIVLKCLEPNPADRPSSALAVAAALPGGDLLEDALAAGKTPSPEMVAAAGEGEGLAPRIAVTLFAAILLGLIVQTALAEKLSALEQMRLDYSPEVLRQKAREFLSRIGYTNRPVDEVTDLAARPAFVGYVESTPSHDWNRILATRPLLIQFVYRSSPYPMTALSFHTDQLTPGVVTRDDPPLTRSGMIELVTDMQGRLLDFVAIPPEIDNGESAAPAVDWTPLFDAAGIDLSKLTPAGPRWTSLATSDTRAAWTGTWPGTDWPLRVEAAAFQGKPVSFRLIGPWTQPSRTPSPDSPRQQTSLILVGSLAVLVLIRGAVLAWRNVKLGRVDGRGAVRLAMIVSWAQIALWIFWGHFTPATSILGMFFLAVATAVFFGMLAWTIYVGLEPAVRHHWPQALISWTTALSGRAKDPIVARDVLFGLGLGVSSLVIDRSADLLLRSRGASPNFGDLVYLIGIRGRLANIVGNVPASIRTALVFFFLLFLFRVILRNQWLAALAFVAFWTAVAYFQSRQTTAGAQALESMLLYSLTAAVCVRFGLLSLVSGLFVFNVLDGLQITFDTSLWYFQGNMLVLAGVVAVAVWAFRRSIPGYHLMDTGSFR